MTCEDNAAHWIPLESNPEVMSSFMWRLGVEPPCQFSDVYGLDDGLLDMVEGNCIALILLFPITKNYEKFCVSEAKRLEEDGNKVSDKIFFMKQTIHNACGTIGLFHTVANNRDNVTIENNSAFSKYFKQADDLSPHERGKLLEANKDVRGCHKESANQGQTQAPSETDKIDLHFVAIVEKDNSLYELDGRKPYPINHGSRSSDKFIKDAAKICQKFMDRDAKETRFSIIALTKVS